MITKILMVVGGLLQLLDRLSVWVAAQKEIKAHAAREAVDRDVARGVDVRLSDDGFLRRD